MKIVEYLEENAEENETADADSNDRRSSRLHQKRKTLEVEHEVRKGSEMSLTAVHIRTKKCRQVGCCRTPKTKYKRRNSARAMDINDGNSGPNNEIRTMERNNSHIQYSLRASRKRTFVEEEPEEMNFEPDEDSDDQQEEGTSHDLLSTNGQKLRAKKWYELKQTSDMDKFIAHLVMEQEDGVEQAISLIQLNYEDFFTENPNVHISLMLTQYAEICVKIHNRQENRSTEALELAKKIKMLVEAEETKLKRNERKRLLGEIEATLPMIWSNAENIEDEIGYVQLEPKSKKSLAKRVIFALKAAKGEGGGVHSGMVW